MNIVVVDTEFTSLDDDVAVATEVAWWDLLDTWGKLPVAFYPVVSPEDLDKADPKSMEINGYYRRGLDKAIKDDGSLIRLFHTVVSGRTMAASNPVKDMVVLNKLFEKYDLKRDPWSYRVRDIGSYAAGALGLGGFQPSTHNVAEILGIPGGDHSAYGDVLTAGKILMKLGDRVKGLVVQSA